MNDKKKEHILILIVVNTYRIEETKKSDVVVGAFFSLQTVTSMVKYAQDDWMYHEKNLFSPSFSYDLPGLVVISVC